MYIPPEFHINDPETIFRFLATHAFGMLTAHLPSEGITASHLPFLIEKEGDALVFYAHLANANPLSTLPDGSEVLLVFTGEHGYVSSSWYTHTNVPTWNYQAVHVYGTLQRQLPGELYEQVSRLTRKYEKWTGGHVEPDVLPARMMEGYLSQITGFRITATRTEAAFKLSQNRRPQDFEAITAELDVRHPRLAEEMRKYYPGKSNLTI